MLIFLVFLHRTAILLCMFEKTLILFLLQQEGCTINAQNVILIIIIITANELY